MKRGSSDDDDAALRIAHLPKEAGWALITAGVVGLAVPGVIGAPFLIAGVGLSWHPAALSFWRVGPPVRRRGSSVGLSTIWSGVSRSASLR
jgi:hypothetical protein